MFCLSHHTHKKGTGDVQPTLNRICHRQVKLSQRGKPAYFMFNFYLLCCETAVTCAFMSIAKLKESMFSCSSKNSEHVQRFLLQKREVSLRKASVEPRTRSGSWYSRFQLSSVWIRSHLHSGKEIHKILIDLMGSLHPTEKQDAQSLLLYRVVQVQLNDSSRTCSVNELLSAIQNLYYVLLDTCY